MTFLTVFKIYIEPFQIIFTSRQSYLPLIVNFSMLTNDPSYQLLGEFYFVLVSLDQI